MVTELLRLFHDSPFAGHRAFGAGILAKNVLFSERVLPIVRKMQIFQLQQFARKGAP
jgi:hypothetical protein